MGKRGPKPFSRDQIIAVFWSNVDTSGGPDACWPWMRKPGNHGYGQLQARGISSGPITTHRLAWELAYGPLEPGEDVLHHCDNKPCCNARHLFKGDQRDNNADMISKGRLRIGGRTGGTWIKGGRRVRDLQVEETETGG